MAWRLEGVSQSGTSGRMGRQPRFPAARSRLVYKAGQRQEQHDADKPGNGTQKSGDWRRLKRSK